MYEITPIRRQALSRSYNPFSIFDEIEKAFFNGGTNSALGFKTDIKETDDGYELDADMPGFDKDQINIEVSEDVLSITAERKSESEEKDNEGNYIRRERSYGSYSRSFRIPDVDVDAITVAYDNGVLKIKMPKKGEEKPTTKKLTIG